MALLPEVVKTALGAQSFRQATREVSQAERESLSRCIGMDVDEWRSRFGAQLREAGNEALAQLREKMGAIKPDALAYTLAVLVDKASAMEGRTQLQNASVNIQVNNYSASGPSKGELLSSLGQMTANVTAAPVSEMRAVGEADRAQTEPIQLTAEVSRVG